MSFFRSQNQNFTSLLTGPEFPTSTEYMTNYTASTPSGYEAGYFTTNFAASGAHFPYTVPLHAWKAFADVDDINTLNYQNSGGAYTTPTGRYLALKCPTQRVYTSVRIYACQDATHWYHIQNFEVRGSNDGSNWTNVSTHNRGTTGWATHYYDFSFSGNTTAYSYWAIYIIDAGNTPKAGGNKTGSEGYVHRAIWKTT